MLRLHYLLAFVACIFTCVPVSLLAQESKVNIAGTVRDENGEALFGAELFIHELNRGVLSDKKGAFVFKGVKKGHYHMHVHFVGYEAKNVDLHAEDGDLKLEIKLAASNLELHEVVVEDNMLKTEKKEFSQSIEVADEDFLAKNAGTSLVSTLDNLAGVNSISTGTNVSKPVIRGFSFNRVIVTENGVKQEGQQWGADHGLEVDQYNVSRVEIVKGPASLQYGSDGIGGMLTIKPALPPREGSVEAELMATARSNNNLVGTSTMLGMNKGGNYFRMRFSSQDFGDYQVPADSFVFNTYVLPIVNERLKNTAGKERNLNATVGLNKHWGFTHLTVSNYFTNVGFFSGAHGIPRAYELLDDGDDRNIDLPRQEVNHFKVISNSSVIIGSNWLEWDLAFQRNNRKEFSEPHTHGFGPTPEGDLELHLILDTYTAAVRYNVNRTKKYHQVHGFNGSMQKQSIGGYSFLLPGYQNMNVGAFTYHKYKYSEKFIVNGGIRFDYGQMEISMAERAVYASVDSIEGYELVNPQINRAFSNLSGGMGFSWFPLERLNVKLNLGTAYKIPTVPELASNGIHHGSFRHEKGDTAITSERSYQVDLNLSYRNKDFLVSVSPFFNYFPNFIFLNPSARFSPFVEAGQIYQYEQSEAINTGVDLSLDYHITKNLHFGLNGDYVWADNLETGYPMPFTPPTSVVTELEYEFEKLPKFMRGTYVGVSSRTTAAQNRVARNEPATDGFQLFHCSLGTGIVIGRQVLSIRFQVNNILNTKYYVHLNQYRRLNIPEPGRNFQLTLKLPLQYHLKNKTD